MTFETELKVSLFELQLEKIKKINKNYTDFIIKDDSLFLNNKYILSLCLLDTVNFDVVSSILIAVKNALDI